MGGEGRPTGNGRRREAHREWEEKGGPQGMGGEGRPTGNGRRREAHREWEEKGGPQGMRLEGRPTGGSGDDHKCWSNESSWTS